jgi:hypothetical protein
MTDNAYRSGYEAAMEKKSGGGGPRSTAIFWKEDGESKVIRLVDDQIITIGMHEFIPTNQKDDKGKPVTRDFVCAAQLANPRPCQICEMMIPDKFNNNELKPARPVDRTLGLAILREENEDGDIVDVVHDKDAKTFIDGEEVSLVGIINQGQRNFWSVFNGYYARYKTTIDRDYYVTRQGKDKSTTYAVIAVDFDPETGVQKNGAKSKELLEQIYKEALAAHPSLVEYIENLGSEDRYNHFLGKKVVATEDVEDVSDSAELAEDATDDAPSAVVATELGTRLKRHKTTVKA